MAEEAPHGAKVRIRSLLGTIKRLPMAFAMDSRSVLVEHRGIEPLTSRLRTLRSPS